MFRTDIIWLWSAVSVFYIKCARVDSCPAGSLTFDHSLFQWFSFGFHPDQGQRSEYRIYWSATSLVVQYQLKWPFMLLMFLPAYIAIGTLCFSRTNYVVCSYAYPVMHAHGSKSTKGNMTIYIYIARPVQRGGSTYSQARTEGSSTEPPIFVVSDLKLILSLNIKY